MSRRIQGKKKLKIIICLCYGGRRPPHATPVLYILWIQHHERTFHLLYNHSHPRNHLPICPSGRGFLPKPPYEFQLVPTTKKLVQLAKDH